MSAPKRTDHTSSWTAHLCNGRFVAVGDVTAHPGAAHASPGRTSETVRTLATRGDMPADTKRRTAVRFMSAAWDWPRMSEAVDRVRMIGEFGIPRGIMLATVGAEVATKTCGGAVTGAPAALSAGGGGRPQAWPDPLSGRIGAAAPGAWSPTMVV
mmetsp:Transcript_11299/g.30182  ORF Transcript_11299/g.30182 Transcript_11299/m.30182 type:complete len:155 (+) Transcript_11299:100-564(+)